jgi:hypothetical protein
MTTTRAARRPQRARRASLAAAVLLCLVAGCGDKSGNDSGGTATEVGNSNESDQGLAGTDNQGTGDQNTGNQNPGNQNPGNQNPGDQNSGDGGGNAVGAPKPRGGGGAHGAPIKLPARVQDSGADLDEEIAAIRRDIVEACGGSVCVHWRIVRRHIDGRTRCTFDHIEPTGEPMVKRGSTFKIIVGSAACEDNGSGSGNSGGQSGSSPSPTPDQPNVDSSPS